MRESSISFIKMDEMDEFFLYKNGRIKPAHTNPRLEKQKRSGVQLSEKHVLDIWKIRHLKITHFWAFKLGIVGT